MKISQRWIKLSVSPYGAPILFVHKKEGMLCMCIDFRMLNKQTKIDTYLIPWIDEILDRLCKAKIFSKIDLRYIIRLLLSHYIPIRPLYLLSRDCLNFQSYHLNWSIYQQHSNGWSISLFKRHLTISHWLTLITY